MIFIKVSYQRMSNLYWNSKKKILRVHNQIVQDNLNKRLIPSEAGASHIFEILPRFHSPHRHIGFLTNHANTLFYYMLDFLVKINWIYHNENICMTCLFLKYIQYSNVFQTCFHKFFIEICSLKSTKCSF